MKLLAIGDVVGEPGMELIRTALPSLKAKYSADLVVVNGENSAETGTGITKSEARRLFTAGADVITTGNHSFRKPGWEQLYEDTEALLRPHNFMTGIPGTGVYIYDKGSYQVAVINLIGQSFINITSRSPYDVLDEILKSISAKVIVVDFHAESTSEKIAMAMCFDGRVSAFFGTHTHVPTADEQILPGGTGYITDLGMTGPKNSVIGVVPALAIKKQRYSVPVRFSVEKSEATLSGALFDIDEKTGICRGVQRVEYPSKT